MNALFLLTEDDSDDLFFEACAERISGLSFQQIEPRRIRKHGGIGELRKCLPAFLNDLKSGTGFPNAFFIIALDNDRAPEHPRHQPRPGLTKRDQSQSCRFCFIRQAIVDRFGANPAAWPAQGAVAVPVQMLESWVLLSLDSEATEDSLPLFSSSNNLGAKRFYAGTTPPPQLKELLEAWRDRGGHPDLKSFLLEVASTLDSEELARKSASFALFRDAVTSWHRSSDP